MSGTQKTEIVSLSSPHVAVVLDGILLLIVQKYEEVLYGVYGEIKLLKPHAFFSTVQLKNMTHA
jgi:hypothetical protein